MLVLPWLVIIGQDDASACSPAPPNRSTSERFADVSTVFAARIIRTEIVYSEGVVATFEVAEVFKGQPPTDRKIRSDVFIPGACGYPFLVGVTYLLFLSERQTHVWLNDDSVRGSYVLDYVPAAQKFLAELRALAKQ
jgi:hypothetical protein